MYHSRPPGAHHHSLPLQLVGDCLTLVQCLCCCCHLRVSSCCRRRFALLLLLLLLSISAPLNSGAASTSKNTPKSPHIAPISIKFGEIWAKRGVWPHAGYATPVVRIFCREQAEPMDVRPYEYVCIIE